MSHAWGVWTAVVLTAWCINWKAKHNACWLKSILSYCQNIVIELRHPNIATFKVSSPPPLPHPPFVGALWMKRAIIYLSQLLPLHSWTHHNFSKKPLTSKRDVIQTALLLFYPNSSSTLHNMPQSGRTSARGQHNALNPITNMMGWRAPPRGNRVLFCALSLSHPFNANDQLKQVKAQPSKYFVLLKIFFNWHKAKVRLWV